MFDNATLIKAVESGDPELLALVDQYLSNPLHTFKPRPNRPDLLDEQEAFCTERFDGVSCVWAGTGSGKTHCSAYKAARLILDTPPTRRNQLYWIASKTMKQTCRALWADKLAPYLEPFVRDYKWYSAKDQLPQSVILNPHPNGNNWQIELLSYDQGRERFQGFSTVAGFWLSEQAPWDIFVEILARCREYKIPGSKIYEFTYLTPDLNLLEIFNHPEKHPDWRIYRMNLACNDKLAAGYKETLLANCPEEERETRLTGTPAVFEGQIFKSFRPAVHVIEPFDVPAHWERNRCIDYGWGDATCCLYSARDPDSGTIYITGEYYRSQASIAEHAAAMNEGWATGRQYGVTWIDPRAGQWLEEYRLAGIDDLQPAPAHDILHGIAVVQRYLRGDGTKPRLLIFRTCHKLVEQLTTYHWSRLQPNKPASHQEDHACDTLRYLCLAIDTESDGLPLIGMQVRRPQSLM